MEINNNGSVNFPKNNSSENYIKKKTVNGEMKQIQAKSADALASQGRAFVNMSFKGTPINPSLYEIKELTDEEFEELKKNLQEKIANLPEEVQKKAKNWELYLNKYNIQVADTIISDEKFYGNDDVLNMSRIIIRDTKTFEQAGYKINIFDKVRSDKRLYDNTNVMNSISDIIALVKTSKQAQLADKILSDEKFFGNSNVMDNAAGIIDSVKTQEQFQIADKILSDERLFGNKRVMDSAESIIIKTQSPELAEEKFKIINKVLSNKDLYNNENIMKNLGSILSYTETPEQFRLWNKILSNEKLFNNENVMLCAVYIISSTKTQEQVKLANKILSEEKLYNNENVIKNAEKIVSAITATHEQEQAQIASKLLSEERLYNNKEIMQQASFITSSAKTKEQAKSINEILNLVITKELTVAQSLNYILLLRDYGISLQELKKLNKIMGKDKTSKLSKDETIIAAKFIDVYNRNDINEIPLQAKRGVLRNLVSVNTELFDLSDDMKQYFPLLPTSQEEYCSLLPSIVRSLGIETNTLTSEQVNKFNKDISTLSTTLTSLSDDEFNSLDITQEYDKDTFIKDTLSVVKNLDRNERQKVYDYFGFELHHNKEASTGFSITGYPVNLNNGHKLAQITDENTKNVVEQLRPLVIKFSEKNHISCNNKDIEQDLNNIISALPELRPLIGKVQAGNTLPDGTIVGEGSHHFDVFKHSLKVMQKISQNPEFNKLNEYDKKIMLLASLLHDITKKEGYTDPYHADIGSFDTFFIAKKFNLSQEEEIKLFNLIKHHEWLGYVNKANDETDLQKRLKDTAYDLRHDNMLDMALIFTHADLKAVKKDDSFHDKTDGKGRTDFNGNVRSFGESADLFASKIKELIEQLKPSQPLLPVTPIPKASTIDKAITTVNSDGSTNIKGIYKDKNGLIVIKYNELQNEDLVKIGFPKGSLVSGIKSKTSAGEDVDTGNIKFFAHGLDYSNQLAKFDAFSLVDSDALLSVSYAERPESKYRFFRAQGVILDCDTKFVHGGGNTDAGSGTGKNIQEFKDKYIFGGSRKEDRNYISDLIKNTLGMTDEEYVLFVKENENKPLSEIEPEEIRTKIINAFASINSNTRKGKREYNEMYISNPKPPMAVFAYSMDYNEKIDNPIDFLKRDNEYGRGLNGIGEISNLERTAFLQNYAIKRDIPFIIFGD